MGHVRIHGQDAAKALETLVPGDIEGLGQDRMRYTLFTNETAGILDDLLVTRRDGHLFVVVNAACKDHDIAHLEKHLAGLCRVEVLEDQALLPHQGQEAASVRARLAPAGATKRIISSPTVTTADPE